MRGTCSGRDLQWALKSPRVMAGRRSIELWGGRTGVSLGPRGCWARSTRPGGSGLWRWDVFEGAWQYLVVVVGRERDVSGEGRLRD
jgi:hypothetical protein